MNFKKYDIYQKYLKSLSCRASKILLKFQNIDKHYKDIPIKFHFGFDTKDQLMTLNKEGKRIIVKSAILLETRKSVKRQRFDYELMATDRRIIQAESIMKFVNLILKGEIQKEIQAKIMSLNRKFGC